MRSFLALLALGIIGTGCASNPLPLPSPAITTSPEPEAILTPQTTAVQRLAFVGGSCPLVYPPREVGSVIRIPAVMMSLAMEPVIGALCACTKPGEYATIVARIDFDKGQVQVRSLESSIINGCLETLNVTFAPPPPNELPGSDCINCGPRHYGVFVDSPAPPKPEGIRLTYSFALDRTSEVLPCPADTHAEKGACLPNEPLAKAPANKPTCGCDEADLMCAMKCSAAAKSIDSH